jgi:hypothetical protein
MSLLRIVLGGAFLLGLAACTPYTSSGLLGGFSETQLAPNVWKVNFQGNGATSTERVSDFVLLRSADLTLQNGFTHFALADARAGSTTAAFTTPVTATTTGSSTRFGNHVYGSSTTTYSGGQTYFVSYPSANNTIVMFKGQPTDVSAAFDAAFLCESIGKKYGTTCDALRPKR